MDSIPIAKWLDREWAVIAADPILFAATIIVVGLLLWRVLQWYYRGRLETLRERYETLHNHFETLRERFETLTRSVADMEAAIHDLGEEIRVAQGEVRPMREWIAKLTAMVEGESTPSTAVQATLLTDMHPRIREIFTRLAQDKKLELQINPSGVSGTRSGQLASLSFETDVDIATAANVRFLQSIGLATRAHKNHSGLYEVRPTIRTDDVFDQLKKQRPRRSEWTDPGIA